MSAYDSVVAEFWRYSTSNPSNKDRYGSVFVKYRTDTGGWKWLESLYGRHKKKRKGWEHTELVFDTKGKSKLEIMFRYDYFSVWEKDETVFFLIDDLKVYGKTGK